MGDPIYSRFRLPSGNLQECAQEPADPKKDPCKIEVYETETGQGFLLERRDGKFQPAGADVARIAKAFPNYKVPASQIAQYLLIRGEFFKVLGDQANPSEITKKLSLKQYLGEGATTATAIEGWVNFLASFLSHGQMEAKTAGMKSFAEDSVKIFTYFSADPTLSALVKKVLTGLKDNSKLNDEARKRVAWFLAIQDVQEQLLAKFKPAMDRSAALSEEFKARSSALIVFLFTNHILSDNGSNQWLFSEGVKNSAKVYGEILSKVDSSYDASKNYYNFVASVMNSMKGVELPGEWQREFRLRLDYIQNEYEKKGREEMLATLAAQPADKSVRDYLKIRYGSTPMRAMALDFFLRHMEVKAGKSGPVFSFDMVQASAELKAWAEGLPAQQQAEASASILFFLQELFEKKGKMEVFWDNKVQERNNFYDAFPLIGPQKTALEKLILWARGRTKDNPDIMANQKIPHVSLRKWTLLTELGIGVAGTATALALLSTENKEPRWYGQGAATIAAGAGFGAALGNSLSYAFDVDQGDWVFDLGGSLAGGLAAGLTYGFTVAKPGSNPQPPKPNPGQRYPVDPYGP